MKGLYKHARVDAGIEAIIAGGGDVVMLEAAVTRLRAGQKLNSPNFNDHPLAGRLAGLRSAVVGSTAERRTVVMVYRVTARAVFIYMVDEHDAAYRKLIVEIKGH